MHTAHLQFQSELMNSYMLIDTALIDVRAKKPWIKPKTRQAWIAAVYGKGVTHVSPVVIDIAETVKCGRVSEMMELMNAAQKLCVSFIEAELSMEDLLSHLRQFIHVCTDEGEELTLRFADGAVLPALAAAMAPEQWSAMTFPLKAWKVHGRDGLVQPLPRPTSSTLAKCPLTMNADQIAALKNAMAVDQLLVNLRQMRPGLVSEYATLQAYEFAAQARRMWHAAGQIDGTYLLLFARGVFDTDGRLLRVPTLPQALSQPDLNLVRLDVQRMVKNQYR